MRFLQRCKKEARLDKIKKAKPVVATEEEVEEDEEAEDYDVAGIIDEEWRDGERWLRVQWVGYDEPTWEPAENCDNCSGALKLFEDSVDPIDEDYNSE